MFYTKPTSELTYEDIADLTTSGEPESISLDYKKMVSGSGREKAELAKDICAFANSQGGYLVIGVEEKRGKPVAQLTSYTQYDSPIPQQSLRGTARILGDITKPVVDSTEWLAARDDT